MKKYCIYAASTIFFLSFFCRGMGPLCVPDCEGGLFPGQPLIAPHMPQPDVSRLHPDDALLWLAAYRGSRRCIDYALRKHPDIDVTHLLTFRGLCRDVTPLQLSIIRGDYDVIEKLLRHGARCDSQAMVLALISGHQRCLRLLRSVCGRNPNLQYSRTARR